MANEVKLTFAGDATSLTKAMDRAGNGAKDMADDFTSASKEAGRMSKAADGMNSTIDSSESKFMGAADLADGLATTLGINLGPTTEYARAFGDMAGGFTSLVAPAISKVTAMFGAQATATTGAAGAQKGLNATMKANPVLAVIGVLVLLVGIFITLYKTSETFRNIVNGALNAVKDTMIGVYQWAKNNWPLLLAILTGPFGLAVLAIVKHKDKILGFIKEIPDTAKRLFSGLAEILTAPFRAAVDGFRSVWNSTIGGKGIPSIGIGPFKTPGFSIPMLAGGGIATGGMPHIVGERGPELFVPGMTGRVVPNHQLGGNETLRIQIGEKVIGEVALAALRKAKNRGVQLGLA